MIALDLELYAWKSLRAEVTTRTATRTLRPCFLRCPSIHHGIDLPEIDFYDPSASAHPIDHDALDLANYKISRSIPRVRSASDSRPEASSLHFSLDPCLHRFPIYLLLVLCKDSRVEVLALHATESQLYMDESQDLSANQGSRPGLLLVVLAVGPVPMAASMELVRGLRFRVQRDGSAWGKVWANMEQGFYHDFCTVGCKITPLQFTDPFHACREGRLRTPN